MHKIIKRTQTRLSGVLLLLLTLVAGMAAAQQGSQGNTTIFEGAQMTLFGAHTFATGGAGTQPGIIKTIRTAPQGILSFAQGTSYTGSDDANHVDGYVSKSGAGAFIFPVGNGTKIRTVGISAPAAINTFKAAYWFSNPNAATLPAGAPFPVANLGTGVTGVSAVEYWDLDGPSAVNVTLTWDAASNLNTLTGSAIANLIIVGYNPATSKWENLGNAGGTTGTLAATGSITANGVTPDTYSAITFGVAQVVPDFTIAGEASTGILAVGQSSTIDVYVQNIKPVAATEPVKVYITRPLASTGLNMTITPSADWTVVTETARYALTYVGTFPASGLKSFTATLARTGGARGTLNIVLQVNNNSGGETNNANNSYNLGIDKN